MTLRELMIAAGRNPDPWYKSLRDAAAEHYAALLDEAKKEGPPQRPLVTT